MKIRPDFEAEVFIHHSNMYRMCVLFSRAPLPPTDDVFDVSSVVAVLQILLVHDSMQTRIATLRWIYHLHIKTPNKVCITLTLNMYINH